LTTTETEQRKYLEALEGYVQKVMSTEDSARKYLTEIGMMEDTCKEQELVEQQSEKKNVFQSSIEKLWEFLKPSLNIIIHAVK